MQEYPGRGPGGSTLREYRSPEEVFSADSLASLASVPVTLRHPPVAGGLVSPETVRDVQIGHVTDLPPEARVKVDADPHEWLKTTLIVADGSVLGDIDHTDAEFQVSAGYTCELIFEPGVTPSGERFDAYQTKIRFNHVAILPPGTRARAGAEARLRLDQRENMKIVVIDGAEYEFGSEKHLGKLQATADAALAAEKTRADREAARADSEKARADKLQTQLSTDSIDKLVEARFNLLKAAAPFLKADYDTSGKSNLQVCKDALAAAGVSVEGKSDEYVAARFDGLAAKDAPAQYHSPAQTPAPAARKDAAESKIDSDDDAFRAHLAKLQSRSDNGEE